MKTWSKISQICTVPTYRTKPLSPVGGGHSLVNNRKKKKKEEALPYLNTMDKHVFKSLRLARFCMHVTFGVSIALGLNFNCYFR